MERYSRQTILQEIGLDGQDELFAAKVVIIGCGGLGSIVAPYLANAGVGLLILVDGDSPDLSNLHRQVFFQTGETATKSRALRNHIAKTNPDVQTIVFEEYLNKSNIEKILTNVDLVIECTDDMMTKYLVNDYCRLNAIPVVYGAIYKFDGYVSLFENRSEESIHLRDIFPIPNLDVPSCSEVGVLPTIAGIMGLLQANEALKYLLNIGESLSGILLSYNALNNSQLKLKLKKSWTGDLQQLYETEQYLGISCKPLPELTWSDLKNRIENYQLISILEDHEHQDISDPVKRIAMSDFLNNDFEIETLDQPTVIYCLSGIRSAQVVRHISNNFTKADVYSLKGGLRSVLSKE